MRFSSRQLYRNTQPIIATAALPAAFRRRAVRIGPIRHSVYAGDDAAACFG
jgi:hypothetical protein